MATGTMRIGELSARCGVSTHVLRAWESRYALLRPTRSTGGYRLYGPEDERRVRAVLHLRAEGVTASEAAERVLAAERADPRPRSPAAAGSARAQLARLLRAVEAFDEAGAQAVVDDLRTSLPLGAIVAEVLMPLLREIGDRWERGDLSIAHEHFASHLIRRRLGALSLTWGTGTGPVAVLACPPGERHDLALLCFGLLLGRAGWRIRFLGQDTPLMALAEACRIIRADLVVLSATRPSLLEAHGSALRQLAAAYPLAIGGRGANPDVARLVTAHLLPDDVVDAVDAALEIVRA